VRDKDGNLKIQGIEADRLGDPFRTYTSLDLIGGIHIDRNTGAPTAYDIFNRSIGDFYTYQATIPSSQAFHLFDPLRIDQYRGVSAFHTAINDCTDIYDIINFEKMSAKLASSQSGIVKRNNNNASDLSSLTNDEDVNGNTIKLEAIQSGKISYLEPGEDIVFPDGPSRPSGAFAEFHKILLRNICLGLGIPYSFAVDPSAMSGPTARLEMQQAGRTFRRYQKLLDDKVLRPIKNIVIADAVSRGLIENNVGSRTTKGIFNFGANVSIDLGRESASAISEFKTGLRTAADIYAERGQDFESAMRQRAIEAKLIKDLAEKYGVAPETISDIVTPTPPPPQLPPAPAPKPVAPAKDEPEEGEDEGGDQKPIPEDPIDPSSEELEVKKKETDLEGNCGTGAGGFQPGNECSKGGGDGGKVIAYHGTSKEAAEKIEKYGYDMEKSTDGGMWLTPNKSKIEGKETGAGQHGGVVERVIDESKLKLGGWKEYDKYGTDELVSQGYDGLKLVDGEDIAYKIFNPQKLTKVINKSKKLEALDCGTGSGGFKEGNTCAGGGGEDQNVVGKSENYTSIRSGKQYPKVKDKVDGRDVIEGIPNYSSIGSSITDPYEVEGIREVSTNDINVSSESYSPEENKRISDLAKEIKENNKISPLIVVIDAENGGDKYILEGGHRIQALKKIGAKSFPAKVVIDYGSFKRAVANNEKISSNIATAYKFRLPKEYKKEGDFFVSSKKKSFENTLSNLNSDELKMLIEGMMGGIELAKYDGIDFTPPQGARDAAKRALDVRETKPPSQRGMTAVGIARARDLINGVKLSPDTVKRMLNFLTRHEVDKKGSTWDEQGKGWQAWHGWGGDAGYAWARKIVGQMEARDKKN
jgi:hypothetical protein